MILTGLSWLPDQSDSLRHWPAKRVTESSEHRWAVSHYTSTAGQAGSPAPHTQLQHLSFNFEWHKSTQHNAFATVHWKKQLWVTFQNKNKQKTHIQNIISVCWCCIAIPSKCHRPTVYCFANSVELSEWLHKRYFSVLRFVEPVFNCWTHLN